METPIKIDDLGVPLFLETPICLLRDSFLWRFCWGMLLVLAICSYQSGYYPP